MERGQAGTTLRGHTYASDADGSGSGHSTSMNTDESTSTGGKVDVMSLLRAYSQVSILIYISYLCIVCFTIIT